MMWGLYDTKDNVWMGDDEGPRLFSDSLVAQVAAQILDTRLRQEPGRTRPKEFEPRELRLKDEITPKMTHAQAFKRHMAGDL